MKGTMLFLSIALIASMAAPPLRAHCEIPCGIFGDEMRLQALAEDIDTVEKSMQQVIQLSGQGDKNYNQLVRWVMNKETHAGYIQETVAQYFLTQRIKPAEPADAEKHALYIRQLTLLHEMLIAAMKAKQSTDLAHVVRLRELLAAFRTAYLGDKPAAPHSH
jgi:nickel superoxide dismutase